MPSHRFVLRVLVVLPVLAIAADLIFTAFVVGIFKYPILKGPDTHEYVITADNVLAGHGFTIDSEAPWRPYGFRTPGHLLTSIPLRVLSGGSNLAAALLGQLIVLAAILSAIWLARCFELHHYAPLAGAILAITPTVIVYSINPYETESNYLAGCGVLFIGTALYVVKSKKVGLLIVGLSSAFLMLLRPAAIFLLVGFGLMGILLAIAVLRGHDRQEIRCRTLSASVIALLCTGIAYVGWSARNEMTFGAFQYSTVSGYNLLQFNAAGMTPFLDDSSKQEVLLAIENNYTFLQEYNGSDQFQIASTDGNLGLKLILEHPIQFILSHMQGTLQSTFVFEAQAIRTYGTLPTALLSMLQLAITIGGLFGLCRIWINSDTTLRVLLLLLLTTGLLSILTGGAVVSSRFRLPAEFILVIGCAATVQFAVAYVTSVRNRANPYRRTV